MNATIIMKTNASHPIKIVMTSMKVVNMNRPMKIVTMIVAMIVNTNRPLKIVVTIIMTSIFERNVIGVTPTDANATTRPMIVTTIPNTMMLVLFPNHPKKRGTTLTNHLKKRMTITNRPSM